jgi:hypothetical protein
MNETLAAITQLTEEQDETMRAATEYNENLLAAMEEMAMVMDRASESLSGYEADMGVMQTLTEALRLDSRVVVDYADLRQPSNVSKEQLNTLLAGTPLEGYGWDFLKAEHEYGVNAIFLLSKMRFESSLGKSPVAQSNNNLGGFKANNGEWMKFDNFNESIDYSGKLLSEKYLVEDGSYYNGTALRDVNIRYCLNDDGSIDWRWSSGIENFASQYVSQLNSGQGQNVQEP